jgi:hypothetical protein
LPGAIVKSSIVLRIGAITIAATLSGTSALAQSTFQTITTIAPPPAAEVVPRRERGAPPRARRQDPEVPRLLLRPTLPEDDPYAPTEPEQQAGAEVPQDGVDPDFRGPTQPVDGVFVVGDPDPPVDGANPTVRDYRSDEERERFQGEPAGFDPRLYQIEIEPILDRRPRQLYSFQPYQPTGIRVGSFIVLPEIEFGLSWFSNVFTTPEARSDTVYDVRPSIRAVSNWRRHAAEFRATGTFSSFQKYDTENARIYTLEARARVDVTRHTNIGTLLSRDVTQESRSVLSATSSATERADVTTDRAAVTLNHRFNRLRVQLRGGIAATSYGDVELPGGGIQASDRDVETTTAALRASWEFKPALYVFAEVGLENRDFKTVALSDGLSRDSTGSRYRVGVSFGETGEYLRGEISLGYGKQSVRTQGLDDIDGILVDANLAWRPTRLTSLLFTSTTSFTDTDVAGSPGAASYRFGVEVQHQLRRNLLLSAGLQRGIQKYEGIDLTETDWTFATAVEYSINRHVALFGRYQHVAFSSDDADRDYNASEVRVGLRLRR